MKYVPIEQVTPYVPSVEFFRPLAALDDRMRVEAGVGDEAHLLLRDDLVPHIETEFSPGDLSSKGLHVSERFIEVIKDWARTNVAQWDSQGEVPGSIILGYLGHSLIQLGKLDGHLSGEELASRQVFYSLDGHASKRYGCKKMILEVADNIYAFSNAVFFSRPYFSKLFKDHLGRSRGAGLEAIDLKEVQKSLDLENQLLVEAIAQSIHKKLPVEAPELDDLIQEGTMGLMSAINTFDPSRGVKLSTYATPRIKGSILDFLREMDFAPRLVRSRERKRKSEVEKFTKMYGRAPSAEEALEAVGGDKKVISDGYVPGRSSLSTLAFETGGGKDVSLGDGLVGKLVSKQSWDELKDIFKTHLESNTHQLLMKLIYLEGMTMREAGEVIGISESRISQLHTTCIALLKSRLKPEDFTP